MSLFRGESHGLNSRGTQASTQTRFLSLFSSVLPVRKGKKLENIHEAFLRYLDRKRVVCPVTIVLGGRRLFLLWYARACTAFSPQLSGCAGYRDRRQCVRTHLAL